MKAMTTTSMDVNMIGEVRAARTKPVKPEAKDKKAKTLKSELQLIRKLGVKEDDVLPKAIHEAAIKAIATGGGQ